MLWLKKEKDRFKSEVVFCCNKGRTRDNACLSFLIRTKLGELVVLRIIVKKCDCVFNFDRVLLGF